MIDKLGDSNNKKSWNVNGCIALDHLEIKSRFSSLKIYKIISNG